MLEAVSRLVLLVTAELQADSRHGGELERGREREVSGDSRTRQKADTGARFDVRTNRARSVDEANDRRHTDLADVLVHIPFVGMPPGHVRFADQRKVPIADLPPRQIRIPDQAEIEL